ncbi:MAG: TIGR04219 family outer membrane beta-barrel protein [Colwellia sp.]|nr:TIGR04219 family outer membrane beta-barrel protein [Colwellia sp.]MCW8865265.1 TIGR04219 family outer membrane beta-barrel protein [Colwellia sp.]MCW9082693.1 TIGR04219 family outer membrane beta-barrel protein [Colwellia sp.]
MKKAILAASLTTLLCTTAQADTLLGLYIGGQMWANEAEGSFGEGELDQAVFDFDDENQGSFFVALEHPIPLIPNVKIASTTLDTIGGTTLTGSFTFEGETYTANSQLDTTFDASFVDYTFYYEVFDNDLLTFDFGLTARDLDSQINVVEQATSQSSDLSVSGIIPLFYVNTIVGLPFTGFNVFAEANFLSYDDNTVYDYQIGVSYAVLDNLAVDLDITLGYRGLKLELNDVDDLYSDITFEGVFAGATVHF